MPVQVRLAVPGLMKKALFSRSAFYLIEFCSVFKKFDGGGDEEVMVLRGDVTGGGNLGRCLRRSRGGFEI